MEKIRQMLSGNKDETSSTAPKVASGSTVGTTGTRSDLSDNTSSTTPASTNNDGVAGSKTGSSAAPVSGSLPDRSVHSPTASTGTAGPSSNMQPAFTEEAYQFGDSHPTFTGNRLDPEFKESQDSYHEEKLDDATHRGGGWRDSRPNTAASGNNPTESPVTTTTGASSGNSTSALGSSTQSTGTGPASSTLGPHSSNLANIVDPRVQPDVAAARQGEAAVTATPSATGNDVARQGVTGPASSTTGPHKNNVANVLDPRVQPDLAAARQGKTEYTEASDHATAIPRQVPAEKSAAPTTTSDTRHAYRDTGLAVGPGGAGAAGMAAYEAKDDTTLSKPFHATNEAQTEGHSASSGLASGGASNPQTSDSVGKEALGAEGEKHHGFLDKLLHRDHPNKLHKDPPS